MRNVLLVGITGTGKSSAGNLLCQGNDFISSNSVKSCTKSGQTITSAANNIKVTDTMGFLDTDDSAEVTKLKITSALAEVKEGVHCIMFFAKFGRFTSVEFNAMQLMIETIFGIECLDHIVFVWTHVGPSELVTDRVKQQQWIDQQLQFGPGSNFAKMYQMCQNRVVFVNNPPEEIDEDLERSFKKQRNASRCHLMAAIDAMDEKKAYLPEVARRVQAEYEEKLKQKERELAEAKTEHERQLKQKALDEFKASAEGQKLELMQKQIEAQIASKDREIAELRQMMIEIMNRPPPDFCNIL